MSVCFGGSRSLSSSFAPLVAAVVRSLGGAGVSVGCAAGADELVLRSALAADLPLSVCAVGGPDGAGFWSGSAPVGLLRFAVEFGAWVRWWAGGGARVPLRARLISRSGAALVGASSFVLFLASPGSAGSLAVAGVAVGRGLPVFAFSCGFSGCPAAPRGCAGAWSPCVLADRPAWRWLPEGEQLPLF
jgi:hypothetical protein